MSKTMKVVLAVVGGVFGIGVIVSVAAWAFMAELGSSVISEEQAKEIAFAHAEVDETDTQLLNVRLDDFQREYDIEFYVDRAEYQYEIDAKTGKITGFDVDGLRNDTKVQDESTPVIPADNTSSPETVSDFAVSEADVAKVVLAKVPGAAETNLWIKKDYEDGRSVYEGKIIYDGMEYEFEVDAQDGSIRQWDTEWAEADDIPSGYNYSESQHHNR